MPPAKKKKRKIVADQRSGTTQRPAKATVPQKPLIKEPTNPLRYSLIITGVFFLVALFGMLHHEMWRDEYQAWLVARDAHSFSQIFANMRFEGNPALWHTFLYVITRFTHNPVYMQALHLVFACGFIFVFNRYAPINVLYKILFTFGYFPLYEYAVISRSYGLGILFLFIVCTLYKNRTAYYVLLGVVLALLANVSIYPLIIGLGIAGILFLDYLLYQKKSTKQTVHLCAGLLIFVVGVVLSLYQIWPDKDNSFPAAYATKAFDVPRWSFIGSKIFLTYFYVPNLSLHFWNTNIFVDDPLSFEGATFGQWLNENPAYLWTWVYLPILVFFASMLAFLRKPLILLLYVGTTIGLLTIYYYTGLLHARYCGHLLVVLVSCYWLAEYYPEKKYRNFWLRKFSNLGNKVSRPLLILVLTFNVIGGIVAYSTDYQNKFSRGKDAADYLKKTKLDTLPLVGITDFTESPIATHLDTRIYYPQMSDFGSFTVWNNKRKDQMTFQEVIHNIDSFMIHRKLPKILFVKDTAPMVSLNGENRMLEHGLINGDLQLDLVTSFPSGIVNDEQYFIYTLQRVDSSRVDLTKYIRVN